MTGLPAEFGLPPFDPFFYPYQEGVFDSGDLHAKLRGINNTIEGMRNIRFKTVRPHFIDDTFRLEIDIRMPSIFLDGIIEGNGSMAGFRIGGRCMKIKLLQLNIDNHFIEYNST